MIRAAAGACLALVALAEPAAFAQVRAARQAPVAQPAVRAIVDAFATHDLVALSDPHGDVTARQFVRELVAAPGFADAVNDVVVEFGNARYQAIVDRYVGGEAVALRDLQPSWQDVVTPNQIWADEEFYATVRRVNQTRPPERRLRVLLGDPPIDWTSVRTRAEFTPWLEMRDSFPAALIQIGVLAKRRKALVLYGHLHFQRRQLLSNYDMSDWRMQTLVSLIERATPARVFTIWRLGDEVRDLVPAANVTGPAVYATRDTTLGAEDVTRLSPAWTKARRFAVEHGTLVPVPEAQWRTLTIEEQLDGVVTLGPAAASEAAVPARACAAPGFLDERLRRITVAGIPPFEADRVKAICATARP